MSLTTLFIDMNSYFASVEQQERQEFRGKPTVVVPTVTDSTCCIAVSYEAKRYGIKTGTIVGQARRLCPQLCIVPARPDVYVRYHHEVIDVVESCIHVNGVHSIDELSCRLMGVEQQPQRATTIAQQIKQALRDRIGEYVRCSIGLAPNRFLAKVASDMQKPDGLTVIMPEELPERLFGLELIDLPGIGPRMRDRLFEQGIQTVQQLCALSERQLRDAWQSVQGEYWWQWLRGHDLPDIPTHRRTVGHSHVLPPNLRSRDAARAVLVRLIHRAAARLRNMDYWARQISVYVRLVGQGKWENRASLGFCQDTLTMIEVFSRLWEQSPHDKPLQVGVTLFDLVADRNAPRPLFAAERNRVQLARTMDFLNSVYGAHTVYLGGMHEARDKSPPPIAFTRIPRMDPTEM